MRLFSIYNAVRVICAILPLHDMYAEAAPRTKRHAGIDDSGYTVLSLLRMTEYRLGTPIAYMKGLDKSRIRTIPTPQRDSV